MSEYTKNIVNIIINIKLIIEKTRLFSVTLRSLKYIKYLKYGKTNIPSQKR